MIKGLLALDEDLASSIALRHAGWLAGVMPLRLRVGHVEPLDNTGGRGPARMPRSGEQALREKGRQAIQRLLLTEKVSCPFVGEPKVFIGDRDDEFLAELRGGAYDLFVEGNLHAPEVNDFYKLTSSPLYANTPCSIMVVRNLVAGNKVALLCGDGVDHQAIIPVALDLLGSEHIIFDAFYCQTPQRDSAAPLDGSEARGVLSEVEEMLRGRDLRIGTSRALCGIPANFTLMFGKYSVVASSFPTGGGPELELLAQCPAPVLLCK